MSHTLPPVPPEPAHSTQQAHPWRATLRTAAQGFISTLLTLGVVLPVIAQIVTDDLGQYLPDGWGAGILAGAAFVAVLAGAVARIMAIPAVDAWLRHVGLSSRPPLDG